MRLLIVIAIGVSLLAPASALSNPRCAGFCNKQKTDNCKKACVEQDEGDGSVKECQASCEQRAADCPAMCEALLRNKGNAAGLKAALRSQAEKRQQRREVETRRAAEPEDGHGH